MGLIKVSMDILNAIEAEWRDACKAMDENFDTFAVPDREHARKIVKDGAEIGPEYAIYTCKRKDAHDCLMHINQAELPGLDGKTQKIMWVLLAPQYDYITVSPDELADIASEIISGAIELCYEEPRSHHVKIHIGNIADREFFTGIAVGLRHAKGLKDVGIRGNWLHISVE